MLDVPEVNTRNMSEEITLGTIHEIPLNEIEISPLNVRLSDISANRNLDELADSIRIHGLLQPVVLAGTYGNPPYSLISGQRRFLAHEQILHADKIKAVFAGDLNKTEIIVRSLVENLQRVELDFTDTATAVTTLYEELGNEYAVKDATGLSIKRIRDHLKIDSRASDKIKQQLADGVVSVADVKRALQAANNNIEKAERLIDLIIENTPTAHQKRRLPQHASNDLDAEEIFNEAMKPHIERKIVIALSDAMRTSLEKATKAMETDPNDLVERILEDWLRDEGF